MQQPSPGDLIVISDLAFVKIFPAKDIFQSGQNLESDDQFRRRQQKDFSFPARIFTKRARAREKEWIALRHPPETSGSP